MNTRNFLLLWLLLFLVSSSLRAQSTREERIDRLLAILKTLPDDTAKIRVYGKISYRYQLTHSSAALARAYADSVGLLSEKLDFKEGMIRSHYYYGILDLDEGNYYESLDHFRLCQAYYTKEGDSTHVGNALFGMGKAYSNVGDYDKSLASYYRLSRIYEMENDQPGLADITSSIGNIYRKTGKYKNAIAAYEQANKIYQELGLKKDYGMSFQNLGNAYASGDRYDTALQYYEQAFDIIRTLDYPFEESMVLSNMGSLHEKLAQWEDALSYHLQALAIRRKLAQKKSLAVTLGNVGRSYLKLNNPRQATLFLHESLVLAEEIRSKDLLSDLYRDLSELSIVRNDFEKAYHFTESSHQMKDSIFNETTAKQLNELQAKYETEKKDKQIRLLAQEKEIQAKETQRQAILKQASLGGLFAVLLVAGLLIYTLRQRIRNQKLLAAKDEEVKSARFQQQLGELEMKALRAQMNPHFIFNCINSINRMVLSGEGGGASRYLGKFAKLIRLMLENSENPTVSLEDELVMLEAYLQLESLRFKEKIRYEIVVDDAIDRETTCLPAMVLQPFIENAIWHGLMPKKGDGLIKITIQEDDDVLKCIIEDNGVGREQALALTESNVLKKKSLGLQITEERLKLLSKERLKELIRITDLKDSMNHALGTRVDVLIPIS